MAIPYYYISFRNITLHVIQIDDYVIKRSKPVQGKLEFAGSIQYFIYFENNMLTVTASFSQQTLEKLNNTSYLNFERKTGLFF